MGCKQNDCDLCDVESSDKSDCIGSVSSQCTWCSVDTLLLTSVGYEWNLLLCLLIDILSYVTDCLRWNILGELGWQMMLLCNVLSHWLSSYTQNDCFIWNRSLLPWRKISNACTISKSRNYKERKYLFMYPQNKSPLEGWMYSITSHILNTHTFLHSVYVASFAKAMISPCLSSTVVIMICLNIVWLTLLSVLLWQ